MRTFSSYLRVIVITGLVAGLAEYFIDSGDKPAFLTYPEVPIFIGLFAIALIGIEVIVGTMNALAEAVITPERKAELEARKALATENLWYKKTYKKLLDQKPIEEEDEIIMDHDYDGIQELDNNLPPWWLYGFYISIVFAAVYLIKYHIAGAELQAAEYQSEVAQAEIDIAAYLKTAKDLVNAETVTLLTEEADIKAGGAIFAQNCVACHAADGGGGIGPNLTDQYWILGGGIKNVFHTVSEGGRDGKGMVAWKQSLKPSEIQQVASYVLSLQGTTPVQPKEPQGDLYEDPDATTTETVAVEETPAEEVSTATTPTE